MFELKDVPTSPEAFERGRTMPDTVMCQLRAAYLRQFGELPASNLRLFLVCYRCHHGPVIAVARARIAADHRHFRQTKDLPHYVVITWMRLKE